MPKFINTLKESFDVLICYLVTNDTSVRERYFKRDYAKEILTQANGEEALENLLQRDTIFA